MIQLPLSQHWAIWTCSGPRLRCPHSRPPRLQSLRAGGVGHCVERALAEERLGCRHKQTPVGGLTASQVQRRRLLAPQEAGIHDRAMWLRATPRRLHFTITPSASSSAFNLMIYHNLATQRCRFFVRSSFACHGDTHTLGFQLDCVGQCHF